MCIQPKTQNRHNLAHVLLDILFSNADQKDWTFWCASRFIKIYPKRTIINRQLIFLGHNIFEICLNVNWSWRHNWPYCSLESHGRKRHHIKNLDAHLRYQNACLSLVNVGTSIYWSLKDVNGFLWNICQQQVERYIRYRFVVQRYTIYCTISIQFFYALFSWFMLRIHPYSPELLQRHYVVHCQWNKCK